MRKEFENALVNGGVPVEMAAKLSLLLAPGVLLTSVPSTDKEVRVGASKFGGEPDLPEETKWPTWKGKPLAFLAQINLSDVRQFPWCASLPSEGLLSVFYDQDQSTWGMDPADKGSWSVLFSDGKKLARRPQPQEMEINYSVCALQVKEVASLPELHSGLYDRADLTPVERDVMRQIVEQADGHGVEGARNRLFGHPSQIQGDMALECQLASHGINTGTPEAYESAKAKALAPGADQWRMLLQIDSDENAMFEWGDLGRLFFWITEDALKRRAFDEVWMVLQCS